MTAHFGDDDLPDCVKNEIGNTSQQQQSQHQSFQQEQNDDNDNNNNMSHNNNNNNNTETPAFYVSISLGEGSDFDIPVFENDNAYQLAATFCKENDIDEAAVDYVAQAIQTQLDQYQKSKNTNRSKTHSKQSSQSYDDRVPPNSANLPSAANHKSQQASKSSNTNKSNNTTTAVAATPANNKSKQPTNQDSGESNQTHYPSPFSDRGNNGTNAHNLTDDAISYGDQSAATTTIVKEMIDPQKKYEQWANLIKEKQKNPGQAISTIKKQEKANIHVNDDNLSSASHNDHNDSLYGLAEKYARNGQNPPQTPTTAKSPNRKTNPMAASAIRENRSMSPLNASFRSQQPAKKMTEGEQKALVDKLYQHAQDKDRKLEEARELKQREREAEENQHLTFKPKISEYRKNESDTTSQSSSQSKFDPNRFYEDAKKHNDRYSRIEKVKEAIKKEECPFKPTVSPNSREMASGRDRSPIHDKLYLMATTEAKKKEEFVKSMFDDEHPFRPKISKSPTNYAKRPQESQQEFTERLIREKKEKEEKLLQQRANEKKDLVDAKSGQKLFQPKVNHDEYYLAVKKRDDNKYGIAIDINNDFKVVQTGKRPPPNLSDDFIEYFKEIFELLDSDCDGKISKKMIDLSKLDNRVLEAITDPLTTLDKVDHSFSFDDFLDACYKFKVHDKVADIFLPKKPVTNHNNNNNKKESKSENLSRNLSVNTNSSNGSGNNIKTDNNMNSYAEDEKRGRNRSKSPISKKSDTNNNSLNISKASIHSDNKSKPIPKHYQNLMKKLAPE
jgi:hypothetical protein